MGGQKHFRVGMCKLNSKALGGAIRLLATLSWLFLACRSYDSKLPNDPIQVTVQPDQSKSARIGDLLVTLRNQSSEDLVFPSSHLPWEFNAAGLEFIIRREDGTLVSKTPMIADTIVKRPTLLRPGRELSHSMSLLVYYLELPKELASHDLKVDWTYLPKPTNSVVTKVLTGELLLKKLTPSKESLNR